MNERQRNEVRSWRQSESRMYRSWPEGREVWYYATCPIHGKTEYLTIKGCIKCAKEAE